MVVATQEPRLAARLRGLMHRVKAQNLGPKGQGVDYAGLSTGPLWTELEDCLEQLRALKPAAWPELEGRAFWINLYNVLVMHAVVTRGHPGTNPLRQLAFFSRRIWIVGGQRLSLDDLEHGLLRGNRRHPFYPLPQLGPGDPRRPWVLPLEPRVHFALNCGARSCPPIGVYRADGLEEQLKLATASYLGSEVEPAGRVLRLPQILRWYAGDFGGREGLAELLGRHLGLETAEVLGRRWVYKPYDWRTNALAP